MALGHGWTPKFRITPPAGNPYVVDISAYQWLVVFQPTWEPEFLFSEMLDRRLTKTRYGYRGRCHILLELITPSASETELNDSVLNPSEDDDYLIELSLDGGTTYREVLLEKHQDANLGDKNIGIRIDTVWVTAALAPMKPSIAAGRW
ncbi:MAG TPA: hypothetical protein VGQ24_10615 [Gemmatimonadales bacterium]|jgi:hypothetical protein|nr:hypothetical protein [Gemmatimonadales bacterium]